MTEDPKCQECEELRKASQDAYRSLHSYRPMHTGYRPKSRWYKDDRNTHGELERAHNLAEAKYRLHLATHAESANPRDVVRDLSTVIRQGRLKP